MTAYQPVPLFESPYAGTFLTIVYESPIPLEGRSNAKVVGASDGKEYIIKGPSLSPHHKLVAANELIAAQLASCLGIPVLDHAVLARGPYLFFGSTFMPKSTFQTLTDGLYHRCVNRAMIYPIVAFDVWLINGDRHRRNLMARVVPGNASPPQFTLLANDHSHCFVEPGEDASVLTGLVKLPLDNPKREFVRIKFVQDDIRNPAQMRQAIALIAGVTDAAIDNTVNTLPNELISSADKAIYTGFLKDRRDRLGEIFRDGCRLLPNLGGI